jgi:hypothetical protein
VRRTALVAAALGAAVPLALIAPANAQAASAGRITGSASCVHGGTARVTTTADASGTERATATVSGVSVQRWSGRILLGSQVGDQPSTTELPMTSYVAKHGHLRAKATLAAAQSHDAIAEFYSLQLKDVCIAGVESYGDGLIAGDYDNAIMVETTGRPFVGAAYVGTKGHRYRFSYTLTSRGHTQHRTLVATAHKHGIATTRTRSFAGVPGFSAASVTITDLKSHESMTYGIARG